VGGGVSDKRTSRGVGAKRIIIGAIILGGLQTGGSIGKPDGIRGNWDRQSYAKSMRCEVARD